jgi:hypothetical protein
LEWHWELVEAVAHPALPRLLLARVDDDDGRGHTLLDLFFFSFFFSL